MHHPINFTPAVQPAAAPSDSVWCFAFLDGQLLLVAEASADDAEAAPAFGLPPLPQPWPEARERHYLGRLDERDCWALELAARPEQADAQWQGVALRPAMMQLPEPLMLLAGRAAQVLDWDRTHRFCGVCGTPTERLERERARRCPSCQHQAYPRLSPAMMALVWRRNPGLASGFELLLARSPGFKPGFYSALAGFVEPGESLEDCVHREVAEEVGVQVRDLHYYGSQSWPFPNSLMIAYRAEWAGGEIVPQAGEIEEAAWFDIDALPGIPPRFSISGHLIRDTVERLRQGAAGV
ncbi:NAD(+) diphosphatase [Paucibacter sp. APW11]|uniref:NAD-capped RNA hydrolase NudC n=1 Tax=Roseateles aquae TaxID=3077235 RepID=A0ABU3PDE1_9BURK|nr:NAD(+) diphosphatase [Paucibacter sp. APW11]MDT9000320.1 NAD(+) diphosphatase [Paucibacter sp. APW11]